jgi:hypothetical protein
VTAAIHSDSLTIFSGLSFVLRGSYLAKHILIGSNFIIARVESSNFNINEEGSTQQWQKSIKSLKCAQLIR